MGYRTRSRRGGRRNRTRRGGGWFGRCQVCGGEKQPPQVLSIHTHQGLRLKWHVQCMTTHGSAIKTRAFACRTAVAAHQKVMAARLPTVMPLRTKRCE